MYGADVHGLQCAFHKLMPPRLGGGIAMRDALLARLHEARHAALVVLAASPGYGKTTLLAQWRQQLVGPGARGLAFARPGT
jgi:LuxR family maltose regulon positive regulatory protein